MKQVGALRLAALACLLTAFVGLAILLLARRMLDLLDTGRDAEALEDVYGWIRALAIARAAIAVGLTGALKAAGGPRGLWLAAAASGLLTLNMVGYLFVPYVELDFDIVFAWTVGIELALTTLLDGALLLASARGRLGAWQVVVGAVTLCCLILKTLTRLHVLQQDHMWAFVSNIIHDLAIAALLWHMGAQRVDLKGQSKDDSGPDAPAAAAGLRLFSKALVARLLVALVAMVLGLLTARDHDRDLAYLVVWSATLLSLVLGVTMLIGLLRFVSASPAGRSGAAVTSATVCLGLLLDGWTLVLLRDLFNDQVTQVPWVQNIDWVQGIGQVAGVIGLLGLVAACRAVSRVAGRPADHATVWVRILAVLTVFLRGFLTERLPAMPMVLLLGLGAFVTTIGMLISLRMLLDQTAATLDQVPDRTFD